MNTIKIIRNITLFSLILFCVTCCGRRTDKDAEQSSDETVTPVVVERFDRAVAGYAGLERNEKDSILDCYSPVVDMMGRIEGVSNGDSLLMLLSSSAATKVFQPDIESRLPDISGIERELGGLKASMEQVMPEVSFPAQVYGAVIPYDQSVILADTFVVVGLNHYLGADYEGYGGFDDYRRRLKTADRVASDVAEALIYTAFPYDGGNKLTVLSRLIYEGLIVKAVKDVLPGKTLDAVLGYDRSQASWLQENETRIWQKLAADNMLFSTDPSLAARLVAPSPSTAAINPSLPGRAGRYVGYRIVESYLSSHPDSSAVKLLENKFYNDPSALVGSGYSGK